MEAFKHTVDFIGIIYRLTRIPLKGTRTLQQCDHLLI